MGNGEGFSLSQSALFAEVRGEVVEELLSQGQTVSFEAGHRLFQRGQEAEQLMILQQGAVELLFPVEILGVTREVTMEKKQVGDVVAWSALVEPYHFTLSARCATRCTLTSFNRDALLAFFETDPQAGYLFMRNLAGVLGRRLQGMHTMWVHDLQAATSKRL